MLTDTCWTSPLIRSGLLVALLVCGRISRCSRRRGAVISSFVCVGTLALRVPMSNLALACGECQRGVREACHHAQVDRAAFEFLLSEDGQDLLVEATAAPTTERTHSPSPRGCAGGSRPTRSPPHSPRPTCADGRAPKFGSAAERLYFTADGLEQATHPVVAAHRAGRLRRALDVLPDSPTVLDLGCGIGSDLMAFARAGLVVTGVERDPIDGGGRSGQPDLDAGRAVRSSSETCSTRTGRRTTPASSTRHAAAPPGGPSTRRRTRRRGPSSRRC